MALDPVKNFAIVEVSTGYDASATSIVLATGEAAKLPDPATDGAFNLIWFDSENFATPSEDPNREIIRVTAITDDTLTVTRAQESTTASTKNTAGATYRMLNAPTEKMIDDIRNELLSKASVTDGDILENDIPLGNASGSFVATPASEIPVSKFKDQIAINDQTGTSYTLVLTDASKLVTMENASVNTVTVPPNSSVAFPVGTKILITNMGAGTTTITAGAGVTLRDPNSIAAIDTQYDSRAIYKSATDEWVIV